MATRESAKVALDKLIDLVDTLEVTLNIPAGATIVISPDGSWISQDGTWESNNPGQGRWIRKHPLGGGELWAGDYFQDCV